MAFLDIFKKKTKKAEEPKKKEIKKKASTLPSEAPSESEKRRREVKVEKKPKIEKPAEVQSPKLRRKKKFTDTYRILKSPHITEKATDLTANNQYVFKVWQRSNKTEIKKAMEDLYGVDVLDVKIIKVGPKRRRIGGIEGQRKGYKKAIVKIKKGQKIEVLPR